jgi:hypothetical protein
MPLVFATYEISLVCFALAYRLSPLHPLARYPGPVIAKSSKWWAAYVSGKGNLHRYYKSLHDRYGDVVRVGSLFLQSHRVGHITSPKGPNELSIRDPSLIPAILGQGGLPKGPCTCVVFRPLLTTYYQLSDWDNRSSLVSQRDPIKHTVQRKPWNRAFSSAAVKEYEEIAAKRTRQLLGSLEDVVQRSGGNKGAVLDMASWFNYFT